MADDLPYFPLFPSDWLLETKSLTLYEKGGLLELACSMHSSAKRGYLLFDGKPMPLERVARVLGSDKQTAQDLLNTLLNSGVLERETDSGVLFYPPMVKREKLRKTRQEVGKKGGLSTQSSNFALAKPEQIPKQNCGNGNSFGNGIRDSSVEGECGGGEPAPQPPPDDSKVKRKMELLTKARVAIHWLNQEAGRRYLEVESSLVPIAARLEECDGDIEGVKKMITRQVALWKGDARTAEWLCPATLFRKGKFHEYYANREIALPLNGNGHQPAALPGWKRLEAIDEKVKALTSEFAITKDEGERQSIRESIEMLRAERKALGGG